MRKIISKIRCSNHVLEIEKGRHTKTPREGRLCKICENGEIEDEGHFLLNCVVYQTLREMYCIYVDNIHDLLNMEEQSQLAGYLISSFQLRERLLNGRRREGGGGATPLCFSLCTCYLFICPFLYFCMLIRKSVYLIRLFLGKILL